MVREQQPASGAAVWGSSGGVCPEATTSGAEGSAILLGLFLGVTSVVALAL